MCNGPGQAMRIRVIRRLATHDEDGFLAVRPAEGGDNANARDAQISNA